MPTRRGFSRGHPSRRQTAWELGPGGDSVTAISTTSSTILGAGSAAVIDGLTIVRIRGNLSILCDSVSAIQDGYHGAVGIGVVTSDAFAVGVTAVPNPLADANWDGWMYHRFFDVHAISATIGEGVNAQALVAQIEVDTKAMRKLPLNETVFMSMEVVEDGTSTLAVRFDSRLLVKLP